MKYFIILTVATLFSIEISANNVQVTNLSRSGNNITFDLNWENSWRSGITHHDAVWIFVKQAPNGGPSWIHTNVSSASTGSGFTSNVPSDQVGFFVYRSSNGYGTSSTSVTATLIGLTGIFQDIKVMAVEMVHIPEGNFYAGDGGNNTYIARGDNVNESIHITNDGPLDCGSSSDEIQYSSGTCDNIPSSFPVGYDAFYIMKYVITQAQYVDFLNCLPRTHQENRVQADITGSTVTNYFVMSDDTSPNYGNIVRCDENIGLGNITFYCDRNQNGTPDEDDDGMSRACNYISALDWLAYLDWAGLRPFTFLEAEKAARGPLPAVPDEYSWGSSIYTNNGFLENAGTSSEKWSNSNVDGGISTYSDDVIRVGCNAPSSGGTRELSNASYYGVIDLGNNPSDFYINKGYVSTYEPIEGDGILDNTGSANTLSWPNYNIAGSVSVKIALSSYSYSSLNLATTGHTGSGGGRGVRSNF